MDDLVHQAEDLHRRSSSWVTFFRDVFGVDGLIRRTLSPGELREFWTSETHHELAEMLADLRSTDRTPPARHEPEQMITIRIPVSLHELLITETREADLSLNKLAITKLLQRADPRFTPEEPVGRRGRRFAVR